MTKRWTDEDVVKLTVWLQANCNLVFTPKQQQSMEKLLQPFRPDPEEELIEAMHRAFLDNLNETHDSRRSIRAALAVIKERGHYASHGDGQ